MRASSAAGGWVPAFDLDLQEVDSPEALARAADLRAALESVLGLPAVVELCPGPVFVAKRVVK